MSTGFDHYRSSSGRHLQINRRHC